MRNQRDTIDEASSGGLGEDSRGEENGKQIDLIVTDMYYPLAAGQEADHNAGFILLDELKRREKAIPVIIGSSVNYSEPSALGCVWYSEIRDMEEDFRKVLMRLIK